MVFLAVFCLPFFSLPFKHPLYFPFVPIGYYFPTFSFHAFFFLLFHIYFFLSVFLPSFPRPFYPVSLFSYIGEMSFCLLLLRFYFPFSVYTFCTPFFILFFPLSLLSLSSFTFLLLLPHFPYLLHLTILWVFTSCSSLVLFLVPAFPHSILANLLPFLSFHIISY